MSPTSADEPAAPSPQAVADAGTPRTPTGRSQRQHIVDTALSLMAQRGVDGTSMRDLANAAGLNVASLYHYFPSKRDLVVAVLDERGLRADLAGGLPSRAARSPGDALGPLLEDVILSMLEVEDFIRLMLGEVMRGGETAHAIGVELLTETQRSLERWISETRPDLCEPAGAAGVARMLRAMVVGLFFEHVAGVLDDEGDVEGALSARVREAAAVLGRRG